VYIIASSCSVAHFQWGGDSVLELCSGFSSYITAIDNWTVI